MEYYAVFISYDPDCIEAVVDPAVTRSQVVSCIKSREYDNIVQIDRIQSGFNGQRTVTDVTKDLIDEAEAELAEPFGEEVALPASVVPPVR